jgi:membrane-associated phospholipid phosphatase
MPELRTLVRLDGQCLAVAAALIAAVVAIGLLVGWRPATAADDEVLEEMVAHRSSGVTSVMNLITDIFSPAGTLALGLVIAALLAWRRSPAAAVFVLGSTAAASAVTLVLKSLFARQRPPVIDHLANETDYGFPSGHVTGTTALLVSATIALTVGWSARRILLALIVPAAVVGTVAASRLYLGVHWFSDTAAGAAVGLAGIALALAVLPPDQWRRWDAWLAAAVSRTRVPRTPLGRPASR